MTNIRSLTLALLLLPSAAAGSLAAQDAVAWGRTIDDPDALDDARSVAPRPGGGAYVAVYSRDSDGKPAAGSLAALDENGDVLWVHDMGVPAKHNWLEVGVEDVAADRDGNVHLVVADNPASRLIRLGPDGTEVWTRTLPPLAKGDVLAARRVRVDAEGRIVVGATNSDGVGFGEVVLLAFDGAGDELWSADFPGELHRMELDALGGVITWSGDDDHWYETGEALLTRHGPDGALDWQVHYLGVFHGTDPFGLAVGPTGTIHAAVSGEGETHVLAYTAAGAPLWEAVLQGPGESWYGADLAVGPDGSTWVAGGLQPPGGGSRWMVARFAADGAPSWTVLGDPSETADAEAIVVDDAGVAVVTGYRYAIKWTEALVVSYDADGVERWREGFGDTSDSYYQAGQALTLDESGDAILAGRVRVGGAPPKGEYDALVAKLLRGGPQGEVYCDPAVSNSTGMPGRLWAFGSSAVDVDDLTLSADQLPPGKLTLFLDGRARANLPGVGGGQGTLCLGGDIGRYRAPGQVRVSDAAGRASLQLHLDQTPTPSGLRSILAGEAWTFQAWYRDQNPAWTSNLTSAVEVVFE